MTEEKKEVQKTTELKEVSNNPESLLSYTQDQKTVIQNVYAPTATKSEFFLFICTAERFGLDILKREIWCVKYKEYPAQIFVGRDGFMTLAHRSGVFQDIETTLERIDEPLMYYDRRGELKNQRKEFSYKCTTKVWRSDFKKPFVKTVYESEYNTGVEQWKVRPRTMLEKVADAQCLRRAFNINGVYCPEEMQAQSEPLEPEYSIEDMPKRSKINAELLQIKTAKEMELYIIEFKVHYGQNIMVQKSGKRGDDGERWERCFRPHINRVNNVSPIEDLEVK